MTDISSFRFQGRSRTFTSLWDQPTNVYTGTSRNPSKRQRPLSFHGEQTFQKDMKDAFQQAALINIVAAVNEDLNGNTVSKSESSVPGSAIDSLSNTVAVISNLIYPRDKTVSIPRNKQTVFQLPEETVQRKPVYYKHSEDQEVPKSDHCLDMNGAGVQMKVTPPIVIEKQPVSPEKIVKSLPNRPWPHDFQGMYNINHKRSGKENNSRTRVGESRGNSAVRRLGVIKREPARQIHTLSKCDAVDLIEDSKPSSRESSRDLNGDPGKFVLHEPVRISSNNTNIPYYRAKSLPVVFPAKTKRTPRSTPSPKPYIYNNRPISKNLSKRRPDSMYSRMMNLPGGFGLESLTIGNGVNQNPDIFSPLSHDSSRPASTRQSFVGIASKKPNWSLKSGANSCQSNAIGIIRLTNNGSSYNDFGLCSSGNDKFNEAVRSAISGLGVSNENDVVERTESPERKKDEEDRRTPRRVQFLCHVDSVLSDDSTSVGDENQDGVNIQSPMTSVGGIPHSIQPMSVQELLRFKQKIVPANMPDEIQKNGSYFSTSSGLKIYNQKGKNCETKQLKDEEGHNRSTTDIGGESIEAGVQNSSGPKGVWQGQTKTDIESVSINGISHESEDKVTESMKLTQEMKMQESLPEITQGNKCDKQESTEEFYKLVKAIDPYPYAGFEHKKLRKFSGTGTRKNEENAQSHYVKIKLS